jgi:hypothetical protein
MLEIRRHRVFKLKIGANPVEQDLKHVVAIKRELGDSASVRVDVNQYWDESQAIRACQVLGDNGIDLIEQPISRINRAGQVRLNQRSPAPIMADESIESVEDAFSLAADGAASIFALKIAKNGGPRAVLRTAQIAEAAGIALYGGTMLEGAIGTLASAHAFLTLRQLTWDTELFGPLLLTEEIVNEPPQYRDFQLHVPYPRPGPDPGRTAPGALRPSLISKGDNHAVPREDDRETAGRHGPGQGRPAQGRRKGTGPAPAARRHLAPPVAHRRALRQLQRVRCAQRRGAARHPDAAAAVPVHGHRGRRPVPPSLVDPQRRPLIRT